MKNQNTTTTATRPNVWELPNHAEEMKLCEVVRYIDLRAMHQSNGTDTVIRDLMLGCYLDKLALNMATHQTRIDEARTIAKAEREQANTARRYLARLTITEDERAEAEKTLSTHTYTADNLMGEVADIEKADRSHTVSLAEDMLHAIWIELQAIKADPNRQTEKAFGELCKAGRKYITSMTAVSCIDGMNTTRRPLTITEAVELMRRYDVDPGARPRQRWAQTVKGCTGYYTLEADNRKKDTDPRKVDPATVSQYMRYNDACIWYYENVTIPAVKVPAKDAKPIDWGNLTQSQKAVALGLDPADTSLLYEVCHVPTIRTHHATEDMNDHDPRTAQAVTASTLRAVDVRAIAERANLTPRESKTVYILTDTGEDAEAVALARTAYREAIANGQESMEKLQSDRAKAGKKPHPPATMRQLAKKHQSHADNVYTATLWAYALTEAKFAESGQREAKRAIVKKLTKAYHEAPEALTPGRVDYAHMMQSISRGQADSQTARPDMVTVWTTATAYTIKDKEGNERTVKVPNGFKPVIRWEDSGRTVESLTPGIDYRAEEVTRRELYRLTAPHATAPAMSEAERAKWEKLCIRVAEIGELWRAFSNGEPTPDFLTMRDSAPKVEHKPDPARIYYTGRKDEFVYMAKPAPAPIVNTCPFVYGPPRPIKSAEESADIFRANPPKATPEQMAKVSTDAYAVTKYGIGIIKEINGDIVTVKIGKGKKNTHFYNAPQAIASGAITII